METTSNEFWTIRNSLVGAALIVGISAALAGAQFLELITDNASERSMGVVIGMVLVVTGNYIPKTLEPLARHAGKDAVRQSVQRFAGWALVLGGLGHALAWVALPIEYANYVAMAVVATSVVVVAVRWAWACSSPAK